MIRLGLSLAVVGWVIYTAGGTQVGGWAIVLGLGILAVRFRPGRGAAGAGRITVGHSHGAGRPLLRHEGNHVHTARSEGVRVVSATVTPSSGLVKMHRGDVERMSSRAYLAFMYAGKAAAGTAVGCSADRANVRAERRRMQGAGLTTAEVRKIDALAQADAARYARSSKVDKYADRLGERGQL
ncbi:MAG: hypothetical protein L0I76_23045 [Pseudonocardia sp.]|nr:hypothetical protein [Pseudonocardia sp.]